MAHYRSKLITFPRSHKFGDTKIASRIGEKLGFRLNDIGISHVEIDFIEELSRPFHYRKMVVPFFHSVKCVGIGVSSSEQLESKEALVGSEDDDGVEMVADFYPGQAAVEIAPYLRHALAALKSVDDTHIICYLCKEDNIKSPSSVLHSSVSATCCHVIPSLLH
ncbi:hypothetical protein L2E82_16523 [Cichorium intybus]|uniref:Uncharacterized protein n=1 Tax=Cichorium intybus TaxID=13427 RepID=A0ACB9F5A6_CICIN|nr:hypothetical protein L2E82_16523 [Cichorium intybus]